MDGAGSAVSLMALGLTVLGTLALAYDAIVGHVRKNEAEVYEIQMRNFREWRSRFEQGVLLLPDPPYSAEDKRQLLDRLRTRYGDLENQARSEAEQLLTGHRWRAFGWSMIGLTVMLLGIALQAYALVAR